VKEIRAAPGDSTDDQIVWNPQVSYDRIDGTVTPTRFAVTDNSSSRLKYSEQGWQRLSLNPWNNDVDQEYLPGWFQGSISVSAKPGATMSVKFHGTGIEAARPYRHWTLRIRRVRVGPQICHRRLDLGHRYVP